MIDTPFFHEFHELMFGIGENNKVFNSIVKTVPINVVDVLISIKMSLKKLFHHISVFSNHAPININLLVFMFWIYRWLESEYRKLREMSFSETRLRTVFCSIFFSSVLRNVKRFFAVMAIKNFPLPLPSVKSMGEFISAFSTAKFRSFVPLLKRNSAIWANSWRKEQMFPITFITAKFRSFVPLLE